MIAWVSPDRTVRSTPRRISLAPSSVSTVTCRSRISRVDMGSQFSFGDGDEHVVAVDLHGVDGDGDGGRQAGRLAGAQVEARAVQPALDRAVLDLALGQRDVGVRCRCRRWRGCRRRCRARSPTRLPSTSAATAPTSGRSSTAQTRTKRQRLAHALHRLGRRADRPRELGVDGRHQVLLHLRHADPLHDVGEEAAHDQAAGLVLGDAARLQVEQLLVVEPAGRARRARRRRSRRSRSRGWAPSRRGRRR